MNQTGINNVLINRYREIDRAIGRQNGLFNFYWIFETRVTIFNGITNTISREIHKKILYELK